MTEAPELVHVEADAQKATTSAITDAGQAEPSCAARFANRGAPHVALGAARIGAERFGLAPRRDRRAGIAAVLCEQADHPEIARGIDRAGPVEHASRLSALPCLPQAKLAAGAPCLPIAPSDPVARDPPLGSPPPGLASLFCVSSTRSCSRSAEESKYSLIITI